MADPPTFRAGKPTLTSHPVTGGDALRFPIAPPPPGQWWIALRRYATANQHLTRPWDEPNESSFTVECPDAANLDAVIDAVNQVLDHANHEYAHQLAAGEQAQQRFDTESTRRQQERENILRAINDRYSDDPSVTSSRHQQPSDISNDCAAPHVDNAAAARRSTRSEPIMKG